MSEIPVLEEDQDPSFGPLMRSLALEALFYVPVALVYFFLFQRFINTPLFDLYKEMPVGYAILGTLLILVQGILLEVLTSWLLRRIGLRN
jgi:NhaP-type Na+/H+ or K+/H+ antiporter